MSMSNITHVVLHYSATYADDDITAADIDRMHKARGWRGIGYHWFIRRDGTVEQGRPESQVGAHVGGRNSGKIGICCAGGLERDTGPNVGVDNRTRAQIAAQIKLIRDILKRHPGAQVVGHRDLAPTQCPGFDVRPWWAKVQRMKAPRPTPAPRNAPAKTPGVGEDDLHVVERGDTWWSIAQEHDIPVSRLLKLNKTSEGDVLMQGRLLVVSGDVPSKKTPVGIAAVAAAAVGLVVAFWENVSSFVTGLF